MTQSFKFVRVAALTAAFATSAVCFVSNVTAGTATSNVDVTANVTANCIISTTGALAFGNYDPVSANASADNDATGTLSVTCTTGSPAAITLGQGANANAGSTDSAPLRRMASGTDMLSYDIYRDTGRTLVWGNDTTVDLEFTGNGTAQTQTLFGRIPAGQNVPVGNYADTVVATVTF